MSLFDKFTSALKGNFDKKKEEREIIERVQKESRIQQLQIFEEEAKKNALLVAQAKAKKEAAELTGLQKLRQISRARNLQSPQSPPGSFFEKLGSYTQKNIARREENLKKTAELRKAAEDMKKEKGQKISQRNLNRKPSWGQSTWKK